MLETGELENECTSLQSFPHHSSPQGSAQCTRSPPLLCYVVMGKGCCQNNQVLLVT